MKRIQLLICFFMFSLGILHAQKHDYNWLFNNRSAPGFNETGFIINFNESPPRIDTLSLGLRFWDVGVSFSDSSGQLLFYSNGTKIFNAEHNLIENGDTIGTLINYIKHRFVGTPQNVGNFVLPAPEKEDMYYLFYTSFGDLPFLFGGASTYLYYAVIDMSANGGSGKVLSKNNLVRRATNGRLTSTCKHGNGRDWWIITSTSENTNQPVFAKYLLTPDGLEGPNIDTIIGPSFMVLPTLSASTIHYRWAFPHFFSPDGQYFFHPAGTANWAVASFNRCTGELSYFKELNNIGTSLAIASDSRTLYGAHVGNRIYTVKLPDSFEDIDLYSKEQIPFISTRSNPSLITCSNLMLAPDNKIYGLAYRTNLNEFTQVPFLHVIHNPLLGEMAADAEFEGVELPSPNYNTSHVYPNYRLGKLLNSPCDSIP